MSLTTQLYGGELGEWCAHRLTGTPALAATVTAAASRHRRPVRPTEGPVPPRHWAEIGGAFGMRLAALVQPAPPYYSLYGLVRAGLVSRTWANAQAAEWPTHAKLGPEQRLRALEVRPVPDNRWLDLGPVADPGVPAGPAEPVLADLLQRTRDYLARHAPCGQLGTPGVEAGLARVFWLLSQFEDVYRSGALAEEVAALFADQVPTVDQLRGAAAEPVVAELVALTAQLQATGALNEMQRMAGDEHQAEQPLGIAGPVLVHHWADADLLIGDTLLDVKTVIRTDNPDRIARWLWQILAYAWLDVADRYRIRSVGLYLARHGALLAWGVETFADHLLAGTGRADTARREFLALARQVIADEGARPPAEWKPRRKHVLPWSRS